MLTKIGRQECLEKYPVFPLRDYNYEEDEDELFYPEVFKSYILTIPSKSLQGQVATLGKEIVKLAEVIKADTLIYLGDTETAWLYQDNDYKHAIEAQQYLTDKKIGKRFNGALQVNRAELPVFIKHLSWLTRCNAALPYFHFTNKEQNIVGRICKYGNLHLNTLSEQVDKILRPFIDTSKFEFGDTYSCRNWFGKSSAIYGRQTSK